MSEHWKSTPKYYCKHCLTYVRDTKLERANHEATGKHQGAVRRALSALHRAANNDVRDRERAKREIDRLNGVVNNNNNNHNSSSTTTHEKSAGRRGVGGGDSSSSSSQDKQERTRQAEQLAALGVALPQQFRGELAMPGEWSVTSTTVVNDDDDDKARRAEHEQAQAQARGAHKRERTEEQLEHEAAVKGLFKKPRRWGRDARGGLGGGCDDDGSQDLDALLSGGLVVVKKNEEGDEDEVEGVKHEEGGEVPVKDESGDYGVKKESLEGKEAETTLPSLDGPDIKTEDSETAPPKAAPSEAAADMPVVVAFKKRKAKNIRQK